MSNSLRDQLLGLGFKPTRPERKHKSEKPVTGKAATGKPGQARAGRGKPGQGAARVAGKAPGKPRARSREEIDLAKAYALRARQEKEERLAAEQARQEEARRRREAKARLGEFLEGKVLNDAGADIARHFPYGGKIKRIHVTADQLRALNAGELGVVQLDGRYLLVTAAHLAEAEAIFPQAVALKVDPDAPSGDDPYADPKYQVPDDLVW